LDLGGAVDLPAHNWNPAYGIGYGYGLELGSPLEASWILSLGLSYFHFQGVNYSGQVTNNDLRILPSIRYFLLGEAFRPYVMGGLGLDIQIAAAPGDTAANLNPEGFWGLGLETRLGARENLFLEARHNFILAGGDWGQDIALSGGLRDSF
jgi:hypothetical protein